MGYHEFIKSKTGLSENYGFSCDNINDLLFDWQKYLVQWALRKGRSAIFADCGLGKSVIQLEWAQKIVERTNEPILILAPLAVGQQTVNEGEKFGIECCQSRDGEIKSKIVVANYERLHYFNKNDFIGVVCDESSILKSFGGVRQSAITEFMKQIPYRLLCTATAAPNDFTELGTSSQAIGEMGHMDMLTKFFRNVDKSTLGGSHGHRYKHREKREAFRGNSSFWRFKPHAEVMFWKWVSGWSRALRKPSDIGEYDDSGYVLPPIKQRQFEIKNTRPHPGELFPKEAVGRKEELTELKMTLHERCEKVAEIVNGTDKPVVVWCQLNPEGDYLEKLIPDSVQVAGKHQDVVKEERLIAFQRGDVRGLITKPKIAGFGLNWQHCAHMTFFPSHSFEQFYQSFRRCWRFGQDKEVQLDMITTPGMRNVLKNLKRKADQADKMFSEIVRYMNDSIKINSDDRHTEKMEKPKWLS